MALLDVRRLAAVDMWGASGSQRRRRIIRAEFVFGAAGCLGLGLLVLATSSDWMIPFGVWLVGAGINYVPLALHAQALAKPGALEDELDGLELRHELRRAGLQQLWIAVPLAVAGFAWMEVRARRSR